MSVDCLNHVIEQLLQCVKSNDVSALSTLASDFHAMGQELRRHRQDLQLSKAERRALIASAHRIAIFSTGLAEIERRNSQHLRDLATDCKELVATSELASTKTTSTLRHHQGTGTRGSQLRSQPPDSALNATVMRQWLLEHIDHPFPSNEDKRALADESNRRGVGTKGKLQPGQCTLWFINARRRSGWTLWARRFCRNEPPLTRAIVAAIQGRPILPTTKSEAGEGDEVDQIRQEQQPDRLEDLIDPADDVEKGLNPTQLAELCRHEFEQVIDWVEQGANQRVGDWMERLAEETKGVAVAKKGKGKSKKRAREEAQRKALAAAPKRARTSRAAQDKVRIRESDADDDSEDELPASPLAGKSTKGLPRVTGTQGCTSSDYSAMSSRNVSGGSISTAPTSLSASATLPETHKGNAASRPSSSGSSLAFSTDADGQAAPSALSHPWVQQYLEQQRAENAATMAAPPSPSNIRTATPSARDRPVRKLPARAAAATSAMASSSSNVFVPPTTAAAAVGANWGLPPTSSGSGRSPGVITIPEWSWTSRHN
ncbi:hypothetical protein BDZ90DRAFT_260801 [Jaminaea rosea]|uniref:KN homeodomain domain-containing protein n=1 Tax=Jaminaea rosea TaxID=1569628 RepID=A0A316UVI8_9BASI|nr:hypothetical protein BDZ90DRAFT_260801 [Jaminaea rosea]PWN27135.1 hypothetical protein BDZ90DRAFT_260801 [Jaminaea rosea]